MNSAHSKQTNHCQRVFLGWNAPALPLASKDLIQRSRIGELANLEHWICALPTAQAVSRFRKILLEDADREGLSLRFPTIITAGELPERLYVPKRPAAIEFEQTLAWSRVLRNCEPKALRPLLPVLPDQDSLAAWLELAGTLRRLSGDLSSHAVSFHQVVEESETQEERTRWQLLAKLYESYLNELESAGLSDPLKERLEAERRDAVTSNQTIVLIGTVDLNESIAHVVSHHHGDLISLIAAPVEHQNWFDLLGCLKPEAMSNHHLPLLDEQLVAATSMGDQAVAAVEVIEDFSKQYPVDKMVVGTTDEGQVAPLEIELQLSGHATYRHLGWTVASTSVGKLIDLTAGFLARPTWQSLAALARHSDVHCWLQARLQTRLEEGAKEKRKASKKKASPKDRPNEQEIRVPDVLVQLDKLLASHFPVRLADPLPPAALSGCVQAHALREDILVWLEPLIGTSFESGQPVNLNSADDGEESDGDDQPGSGKKKELKDRFVFRDNALTTTRPLAEWCRALENWLNAVYPSESNPERAAAELAVAELAAASPQAQPLLWDEDPLDEILESEAAEATDSLSRVNDSESESPRRLLTTRAVKKVLELLNRFGQISGHLDVPVSAAGAMETLAGRLADLRVGKDHQEGEIQISGWLDLAFDDCDAMVVTGLNHPFVPSSVTSDPFLPGSLRSKIRVSDNERRFARDLYAMQLMISSRPDIRFIVGRASAEGSPTPPSRLLAAAAASDVARRMRLLLGHPRKSRIIEDAWSNSLTVSQLPLPTAVCSEFPKKALSVTAFKAFLDCPFRFYLRHVLGLRPVDDASSELAANQFGDLVHGALEGFGLSESRDETEEKHISKALRHHLHEYARKNYGERSGRAVRLQLHQAERRLDAVALEQAKRIGAGWKIKKTEAGVDESSGACVKIDEGSIGLRGRFDRIDQNEDTKQWAILDYKTHGHKPEKKHLKKVGDKNEWIDLQLPLYRRMIPFLGIKAPPHEVQLGYFNVGDKPEETGVNIADFSEADLIYADEVIEDCVRRILQCEFLPAEDGVQYDDYEMIMQTGVTTRMLSAENSETEETQQ